MTNWAPGKTEPFPKRVFQLQVGRAQQRKGGLGPEGTGRPVTEPPDRRSALGVSRKGCSSQRRRQPTDPRRSSWITAGNCHGAKKELRMAGELPRRSSFGCPTGVPPRVPLAPLQATESPGSLPGKKAVPARVPCQRAHAGRPRLTSLRAPGDWRLGDGAEQGRGRYWQQSTITQQVRKGRGLFREGHDCEAFSRPLDAIFSLIFLFVCLLPFVPCCS